MKHLRIWITLFGVATLGAFVASCLAPDTTMQLAPVREESLTAISRAAVPSATPTAPCDVVPSLAPDRPTIPAPSAIPQFTLSPIPTLGTAASDLVDAKFYSKLIGKEMNVLVYLPPGYHTSTQRYPVIYMLSGFGGDYREWAIYGLCRVLDALVRNGQAQPMILAMPEGAFSYWFNHAPAPGSDGKPYGDYVWREVVQFMDTNYRTLPRRESRAIGGLSAGGQGALMLGLTHPEVFSTVGAHSPSFRGADGSLPFFGSPEYFKQYDPAWLIENTTTWKQLTLWMDMGHEDKQWGGVIQEMHTRWERLGVPHEFQDTWPGVHDADYWSAHTPDYLRWYSRNLEGE